MGGGRTLLERKVCPKCSHSIGQVESFPQEALVAEAYERKKLRYVELGAVAEQRG